MCKGNTKDRGWVMQIDIQINKEVRRWLLYMKYKVKLKKKEFFLQKQF